MTRATHPDTAARLAALFVIGTILLSSAAFALEAAALGGLPNADAIRDAALGGAAGKISAGLSTANDLKTDPPEQSETTTVETTTSPDGSDTSTRISSRTTRVTDTSTSTSNSDASTSTMTASTDTDEALSAISDGLTGGFSFDTAGGASVPDLGLLEAAAAMADASSAQTSGQSADDSTPASPPTDSVEPEPVPMSLLEEALAQAQAGGEDSSLPPAPELEPLPTVPSPDEAAPEAGSGSPEVPPETTEAISEAGDVAAQAGQGQDGALATINSMLNGATGQAAEAGQDAQDGAASSDAPEVTNPADDQGSSLSAGVAGQVAGAGFSANSGEIDFSKLLAGRERIRLTLDIDKSILFKEDGSASWNSEEGWAALSGLFAGLKANGDAATAAANAAASTAPASSTASNTPASSPAPTEQASQAAAAAQAQADDADDRPRARVAAKRGGGGGGGGGLAKTAGERARVLEGELLLKWIGLNVQTYAYDGHGLDLYKYEKMTDPGCKACRKYTFVFYSDHPGYGDRAGLDLEVQRTPHFLTLVVDGTEVVTASVDNKFDELTDTFLDAKAKADAAKIGAAEAGAEAEATGDAQEAGVGELLADGIMARIFGLRFNLPSDAIVEWILEARTMAGL